MAKTLFDHINAITVTQDPNYFSTLSESDKKTFNRFMILRFLSMNSDWVDLLGQLQPYIQELDPPVLYKLLISVLPQGKVWLRYVKSEGYHWYEDWLLDYVIVHFDCSKREAIENLDILYATDEGKLQVKKLLEMYGVKPKKISSLKLGV